VLPPDDLVDVVDRLHVAVSAGHSLHTAVTAVAAASDGPLGHELRRVDAACRDGTALARALETVPSSLGRSTEPLVATLGAALRAGAPAGPALQRLADTERARRRRRAEARVRRLPVLLLVPLVTTVLPSFVLLTIVPVGLTTARSGLSGITP
jgi:pilus assembly protein TadC